MVRSMKQVPNIITCLRILSSIVLLFLKPLSMVFFLVFIFCGATDILDGYVARKTGNTSKAGAVLDSVADMVFVAVALFIFMPIIPFTTWIVYWIIGIAFIRIFSLAVGYIKYRTFAGLHTYANKATGFILFFSPLVYQVYGINQIVYFVLVIATLSAIEEVAINITSLSLNRDIKSIFTK